MARQIWNSGSVLRSGDNHYMRLRHGEDADDSTVLSHWRTVYSPKGAGQCCHRSLNGKSFDALICDAESRGSNVALEVIFGIVDR